jgi:hypothetical protein
LLAAALHGFTVINFIANEIPASEMVDEHVPADHILVSGQFRSEAKVILCKIPRPQAFIHEANPVHQFPPEEHAKADDFSIGYTPISILFPE